VVVCIFSIFPQKMDDGTSGLKNENAINFPKRRSVRALRKPRADSWSNFSWPNAWLAVNEKRNISTVRAPAPHRTIGLSWGLGVGLESERRGLILLAMIFEYCKAQPSTFLTLISSLGATYL
jgi:hypothetical protein